MRKIFTIISTVLLTATVWAQAPQKMSYQAVIRNSSDVLITNIQIGMQINIRQDSPTGTVVYTETQTPTTNANGLVSVEIGGGTNFSAIDWGSDTYYIETKTAVVAPLTTYTITGVSQLLSVPYALHAKTADSITGGITDTKVTQGTNITITGNGTTATPYVISSSGFTHYVGELYGGGIVVSVWKQGAAEHGLIASLADLSAGIIWTPAAYQSTMVPAGSLSPMDGLANSNAIVAQAGAGTTYAAGLCRAYGAAGDGVLNDWYLPSTWELNQCYNAAYAVNTILGATNGFQFVDYWSSTELNTGYAWSMYFYNGDQGYASKGSSYRVRAVRRF
ncbi:MAG TPA: DUF1566 domain-containing protein [Chryseolinea sp.]|nr:DUF1566 domain-containing protein [Chryseolinea sp.]